MVADWVLRRDCWWLPAQVTIKSEQQSVQEFAAHAVVNIDRCTD